MVKPCAVVVGWRAGARAGLVIDGIRASQRGSAVVFVDNEAGAGAPLPGVVALEENRGFAGGANVGLAHAFADRAITHALLMNDDIELAAGALAVLAEACGENGCASPVIEAPGADAFSGRPARRSRVRPARARRARLPDRRGPLPPAGGLGARRRRSTSGSSSTTRTSSGACGRARRASRSVSSRVRRPATRPAARRAAGRARPGPTTRRATACGCCSGFAGRATARREAANTSVRALRRLREPIGRAKLEGVRDWAAGRMGRGPYPR